MTTQQSRRDLYQAHKLMMRRACLALLQGEPDVPDQPLRRLNVAVFSSALVAVILASLAVIWALLGHGGAPVSQEQGTLIIDKQTGTPYVFCQGGKLCPAVNYASARLALRSSSVNQQVVSQSALTRYQRGPLIGIPALPQPLPEAGLLVRQPWSVCTQTGLLPGGTQTALAGGIPTGGQPLGSSALLVSVTSPGGKDWVIWHDRRMLIAPGMLHALGTVQQPVTVPSTWLDTVPRGPGFGVSVPGMGNRVTGPAGGTAAIGQVYKVSTVGGAQYYALVGSDKLAPITQTQARLLQFTPGERGLKTLLPSQLAGRSFGTLASPGLPASIPPVVPVSGPEPLCVSYSGGGRRLAMQVTLGGQMPSGGVPVSGPAGAGQIALPPGRGALVGVTPTAGQGSAVTYFLVSGGRRYALASQDVAAMLGYDLQKQSVLLPAGVVDLIPQGPALDPAAAARPVAAARH
ncbi:MAG TPA: type VII secretion protein EccB [Streptosporangiaceae bacterium]|nr:type VII secretion protein EccB [Streptosporangiaceae bacterium]